ncbi:MAG: hypothetical protein Q8O31_05260 [Rhodocyclaceae bacterium]|nr:hypothetical protein [Rhodocyclaceae bacterium]
MNPRLRTKLENLSDRSNELEARLGAEDATRDMTLWRKLTLEHAEIGTVVALYPAWCQFEKDSANAHELLSDPE